MNLDGAPVFSFNDDNAINDPYYYYKRVFFYSLIIAAMITIPFILYEWIQTGKPIFLYYGDYNAQQIGFYEHCVEMVRSGDFAWDWNTDLGSNFIGSYSYYMLGSPFFWIMCAFPSSWAPYLMGPMFIVKYVFAAVIAYAYIKRFVKHQNYAVMGALLYAFCGFQIYNTFFNQFHECVALFPLLLLGMEELVQNNRRGLFAFAVAINAMCNYYMFAGQVVFCIIYFLFRFSQRSFKLTWNKFGALVFEAVLGAMLAMAIFIPAALCIFDNSRVGSYLDIKNALFWKKDGGFYWQRYGHIISHFFFPPDIPSRVNMFYGHTERWASISAYLPIFGLSGVFAFFATRKKRTWLKFLIIALMIASVFPALNCMFYMFNSSYYARWFYMMILMMVLGTVVMLDDDSVKNDRKWRGGIIAYLAGCAAFIIPLGLMFTDNTDTPSVDYSLGGRMPKVERFWITIAITLVSIGILWYLFKKFRRTPVFEKACLVSMSAIIVVYSVVHITQGKQHSHSSDFMVDQVVEGEVKLELAEDNFFRIDFYRDGSSSPFDNLGLYWGYPSIECFHTVVSGSIMDFYPKIGVGRTVGSRAETKYYGLRAFTSVKYSFVKQNTKTNSKTFYGFSYYDTQNGYDIYVNENYLPMGFSYTEFITQKQFEKITKSKRHEYLCTYLVVPDELAEYYSQFMTQVNYKGEPVVDEEISDNPESELSNSEASLDESVNTSNISDDINESINDSEISVDDETMDATSTDSSDESSTTIETPATITDTDKFAMAVEERKSMACDTFAYESSGFTATTYLDSANVVFFSVPYDDGWSATVNGEKVDVLRVTYGFMAVECPAGNNVIEFSYRAPGLLLGIGITAGAIVIFFGYLYYNRRRGIKPTYHFFHEEYYEEDDFATITEEINVEDIEADAFKNVGAISEPENSTAVAQPNEGDTTNSEDKTV